MEKSLFTPPAAAVPRDLDAAVAVPAAGAAASADGFEDALLSL